jgi:hypothetical protein
MSGHTYELAPVTDHLAEDDDESRQIWVENAAAKAPPLESDETHQDDAMKDAEEGMLAPATERRSKRGLSQAKSLLNEEFSVGKNIAATWGDTNIQTDGVCESLSAVVCGFTCRAKRLGNMPVLWSTRTSDGRTKLKCIVGPFWPCLVFVTYPLILGCSTVVALFHLPSTPIYVQIFWWGSTVTLLTALGFTGCCNPGIVRRWRGKPDGCSHWIWSDQGRTYRPPKARYDGDCGVVIEEFDHTCPWTGTGIGRRNMPAFQTFVCSLCICLLLDVLLVGGALDGLP